MKTKEKKMWKIIWIIYFTVCAIFFINLSYTTFIEPSLVSVKSVCSDMTLEQKSGNVATEGDWIVAGYYDPNNKEIVINDVVPEEFIESINKHENCHKVQDEKNRLVGDCNYRGFMILNEIECNLAEKYPDWLYNSIY